ncbi:hypothetical protein BDV96DRAFT_608540 [Lophiotrema nucula]|uniref:Microbial-type PARG catalytic domain-containing protein n=1 Tax=Lophiotrema nucula TaxID=690887 RepID=A0A6A5ZVX1_9PLEO|nr:hypothetical protein BDV96DRAFT_608540 [Lophiotrema nucula]
MGIAQIAAETQAILPRILDGIADLDAVTSSAFNLKTLQPLNPEECPGFTLRDGTEAGTGRKGTRIRVFDQDTFDAALELQPGTTVASITAPPSASTTVSATQSVEESNTTGEPDTLETSNKTRTTDPTTPKSALKPVALLNLASELHPGGSWLNGALAQEEALCFRSSLSLSLHSIYYPLAPLTALYSPTVVLIRDAMSRGHALLWPNTPTPDLPVTSVISIAALRRPQLSKQGRFAKPNDRQLTKAKVRTVLRVAVQQGHRKLVLGALGCGAFMNPPKEVAECFLEVFAEEEFQGGWWEDIVFAVLDNARGEQGGKDGVGNFGVFYRALDGVVV